MSLCPHNFALRDVGVLSHVGVKGSVNGAVDLLSVGVLKVMALAHHSLANVPALSEQVRGV